MQEMGKRTFLIETGMIINKAPFCCNAACVPKITVLYKLCEENHRAYGNNGMRSTTLTNLISDTQKIGT